MSLCLIPRFSHNKSYYKKILNTIKYTKNKEIDFFQPEEYEVFSHEITSKKTRRLIDEYIKLNRLKVRYWCANPEFDKPKSPFKNIDIINWPEYTVHWSWHTIDWTTVKQVDNIDKLFICLNNKPHIHRCVLLDLIYKNNLQSFGNLSWNVKGDYNFEYFDNKVLSIDGFRSQAAMPNEQYTSLFNIIAESHVDRLDITEKTYYAMLIKKPTILLAKQGINNRLKHFGFKLLDCIDYGFDNEPDLIKRTQMLLDQIAQFKNEDYNKLYVSMKETIDHNYNVIKEIVHSKASVPKRFYTIYDNIKDIPTNYSPGVVRKIYETTLSSTNS